MADWRLVASAGSSLLIAAIYAYVGLRIAARKSTGAPRSALRRFGAFWLGLATHSAISATLTATFLVGGPDPLLVATFTYAAAVAIGAMFWGLMSYLLYLYVGKPMTLRLVTVAYAAQLVPLIAAVFMLKPIGAHMAGWIPIIDYANPSGSALDGVVTIIFLLPVLFAAGAYLTLFRHVRDAPSRWRLGLIGGSITLWLLVTLLARAFELGGDGGAIFGRALAIAAASAVLLAYEPPGWAQRRFGAMRVGHEVVAPSPDPRVLAARRAALVARTRELV